MIDFSQRPMGFQVVLPIALPVPAENASRARLESAGYRLSWFDRGDWRHAVAHRETPEWRAWGVTTPKTDDDSADRALMFLALTVKRGLA